jgi:prefoldin subunit 5
MSENQDFTPPEIDRYETIISEIDHLKSHIQQLGQKIDYLEEYIWDITKKPEKKD